MSAVETVVTIPEPLLDALGALDYLADLVWDEITDETKNVVSSALHASMQIAHGPEPEDENECDAWDDGWRHAFAARAARLVESERLRLAEVAS